MDLKTSLLVSRQLPEFVRDEYPLFVSFLEAYYEFLETERYTDGVSQKNNLIEKLKDLKNISDIDYSLNDFEDQFFNTFISYLPKDTLISKDFLIKNILPLYQTKGTQKSFQFLFRLLFGQEIKIDYPGDRVLRASSGKWSIENIVRTELEIYNEYIFNGETFFNLPYEIDVSQLKVTINGETTQDFYVRKELKKLYLNFVPELNDNIKIYYLGTFDLTIFKSRQLLGKKSNATAIVEKTARRNIAGLNFYQFFIDKRNTVGSFRNGEIVEITIFNSNGALIPFSFQTLSDVQSISITEPGRDYKVGDEVLLRGSATERGVAVVDRVSSGNIESLSVKIGNFGAGYQVGNEIYANGYSSNIFSAIIDAVDISGSISPNTFTYNNTDIISDFLSVNLSDLDYGFSANVVEVENINTVISDALSSTIITGLGPATNVDVTLTQIPSNANVEFFANSTLLYDDVRISDFNSIGTIKIISPGSGYSVGDRIVFTNTEYFSGQGARAFVSAVNSSGGINRVTVEDGGYNYDKQFLPTLSVISSGTGAVLEIEHFMGQDLDLDFTPGDGIQGKVLSVKVLRPGKGYTVTPVVDLALSGDGQARGVANIRSSFVELPGRWITSDGLISEDEIRLQGKDYYIDFSYVITSQVEFQRYKDIVKNLLNPAGSINYAQYEILDNVDANLKFIIFDEFSKQLAGTVNVISELSTVWGTNTYFEIANNIGLIAEGTYILVNSEIRIINVIINNVTLTVSEPYEYSANDQLVTIVPVPYRAITTEYWRELSINIEGPRTIVLTTEEDY
jgi:hypothetical protein